MFTFKPKGTLTALSLLALGLSGAPALAGGDYISEGTDVAPAGDYYGKTSSPLKGSYKDPWGDYQGPADQVNVEDGHWESPDSKFRAWIGFGYVDAEVNSFVSGNINSSDLPDGTSSNNGVHNLNFDIEGWMVSAGVQGELTDWLGFRGEVQSLIHSDIDRERSGWVSSINPHTNVEEISTYSNKDTQDQSPKKMWRLEAEAALHLYRDRGITVSGLLGYTYDDLSIGLLDVTYKTPYVGLGVEAEFDRFMIRGRAIVSTWAETSSSLAVGNYGWNDGASDSLRFTDVEMQGLEGEIHYRIRDNLSIFGGIDYRKYDQVGVALTYTEEYTFPEVLDDPSTTDVDETKAEETKTVERSAGRHFEYENFTIKAGVRYTF